MLRRWIHYIVPVLMIALALAVRQGVPQVEEARLKVFDVFQRLSPRPYTPVPVRFIDLDDESLSRFGQWPWPRTVVAQMVANLANAGAAVIVFDVVFADPDRTSPKQVLPLWPATPEVQSLIDNIDALPDHDAVLADVVSRANVVLGFVLTDDVMEAAPPPKGSFAIAGDDPRPFISEFKGTVTNLSEIHEGAAGAGSFNLVPEADSIIRRVPLFFRIGETIYPSLAAEALRVAQGARTFILKSSGANLEESFGANTGLNNVKIGNLEIPVDGRGRLWVHFTEDTPERRVPAWQALDPAFDTSQVEGQIVFVGTTAAGLKDLRATPLNPVAAGVEVHIQIVEQILLGHYLQRPDWADGAEILYLILLGLILVTVLPRLGALWSAIVGVAGIAGAIAASWFLFTDALWLLDPIYPSFVVLLVYLAGSLLNFLRTEAEKRQVRGAFSQYLSPALVEQLAKNPDQLVLGGEMRDMTLLFCDIRGFTSISETFKTDPQGLTRLINRFLTPMTNLILDRRGTIDKYMGDCIMAFWNAPLDDAEHAPHGCDSALAMFADLGGLNERLKAEAEADGRPYHPIKIGIGVNSGECVVGNMGSDKRFDYSVLGDAVNLAARLEGQSKNYGVGVVIGETTYESVPDYATLELDLIAVKGKTEAVHIYALMGDRARRQTPAFAGLATEHQAMIDAYRAQSWSKASAQLVKSRDLAAKVFDASSSLGTLDTLHALYEERIRHYIDNPPAQDWDGVFVATTK